MSNNINVNLAEVESASARIKNSILISDALSSRDERSTINANTNSKNTYFDAARADRIKELGNKFQEFDTLMNTFNTNL